MLKADGRGDTMSLCVSSCDLLARPTKARDAAVFFASTTLTTKKTMA
jgi:hypothetical protein